MEFGQNIDTVNAEVSYRASRIKAEWAPRRRRLARRKGVARVPEVRRSDGTAGNISA